MSGALSKAHHAPSWLRWAKRSPLAHRVADTAIWLAGPKRSRGAFLAALPKAVWILFWMRWAGLTGFGRVATRLAGWFAPPYRARRRLADLYRSGYVAPSATVYHPYLRLGANVFLDEDVLIYQGNRDGGPVELEDGVAIYRGTFVETGDGGSVTIGAGTRIHPGCQLMGYKAPIQIGREVGIAQNCALYPYDHGTKVGESIHAQPLESRGGITIDDGAWLGTGVIVLTGVRIGKGAVVGAGSVVWRDVPDGALAVGVPARVVRMRDDGTAPSTGEGQ